MSGDALKVAVIGAGDMGERHVTGWAAAGHTVVSVADVDRPRAEALAAAHGVGTVHEDYRLAVADPQVDVVSVCLPLALHRPVTVEAARRGKHVFTEKPLALTMADATAMETAVDDAGVCFGVGFQRNLAPGVTALRDLAAGGDFGWPMVFNSDLLQEVRPKTVMHDRNGNNGPFADAGCHYYLLWQTVFRSRPSTVRAVGAVTALERSEIAHLGQLAIDTGIATVTYESGDMGTLTASWGLAKGFRMAGRPDRILGPRGGAEGAVARELTIYSGDEVRSMTFDPVDLHQLEFGRFAEAIRQRRRYEYGFAIGRQIMAVTAAIFESMATGQTVRVADAY